MDAHFTGRIIFAVVVLGIPLVLVFRLLLRDTLRKRRRTAEALKRAIDKFHLEPVRCDAGAMRQALADFELFNRGRSKVLARIIHEKKRCGTSVA